MNLISLNLIKFPRTIKSLPFHFFKKLRNAPLLPFQLFLQRIRLDNFFTHKIHTEKPTETRNWIEL